MPTYNYKSRELIAKIVYYGPGRCGKTTNLQQVHARMRPETRSDLLSVATETDRTIYFDLLPLNLGTISGMKFMVRLFTVPGQIYYAETRKLVLKGADGVVFVADSQNHMLDENRQSLRDLKDNLAANGLDYSSIPLVMQWNKRDLPHLISEAELNATLNERRAKMLSAVASEGTGVLETLRHITLEVFNHIKAGGKAQAPRRSPSSAGAGLSQGGHVWGGAPGRRVPAHATPASKGGSGSAALAKTSAGGSAGAPAAQRAAPSAPLSFGSDAAAPSPARRVAPPPPPLREDGPQPVRISPDMVLEEFKHLAVMHSQLAERLTAVENEMVRLGRENQEMRELLVRQSRH